LIVPPPTNYPTTWIPTGVVLVPVSSLTTLPTSVITHIHIPTTVYIPPSITSVLPPPALPSTLIPIHVTELPSSITVPSSLVVPPPTNYPTTWIPTGVILVPVSSITSLPSSVITHIHIPSTVYVPPSITSVLPPTESTPVPKECQSVVNYFLPPSTPSWA